MMHIEIGRIQIALHGVSAQVVEEAAVGLDEELRRRLGVIPQNDMVTFDMGELAIGSVESEATLDVAALRGIIADRMAQVIRHKIINSAENSSQTSTNQGGV